MAMEVQILDAKTFGRRLRQAREDLTRTQDQVARAAGVTRSTISQWETGIVNKVDAFALLQVARYLRTTADWLLDGEPRTVNEKPAAYAPLPADLLQCWPDLTASQQQTIIANVCSLAEHNRALLAELQQR